MNAGGDEEDCNLCRDIRVVTYPQDGARPAPFCGACGRQIDAVVVRALPSPDGRTTLGGSR